MDTKKCNRCYKEVDIKEFAIKKGKTNKTCNPCIEKLKCEHGRFWNICRDCKGSKICSHGRRRANCRECLGSNLCVHNRIKQKCRDCKTGLCPHGRGNQLCRDCNVGYCEHNRSKKQCRDCGTASLCSHGKWTCKECKKGVCDEHGEFYCRICSPGIYCGHGKRKSRCTECNTGTCMHDKQKDKCRICSPQNFCQHKKRKGDCRACSNSNFCIHNIRKGICVICHPERSCALCKSVYVNEAKKYYPYCFICFCVKNPDVEIPRKYKVKELHVVLALKETFPTVEMVFDKRVDDACSSRRPDVRIECLTHTIIIECDENQHAGYSCENKRVMEIFQDLGNRPIVFIRFNPDSYTIEGKRFEGSFKLTKTGYLVPKKKEWKKRTTELIKVIKKHLEEVPEKEVTTEFLYYSQEQSY